MDDFNNYNKNNYGEQPRNSYQPQQPEQNNYYGYYGNYQGYGSYNEVTYKPENKKSKGRKILNGIIAVLAVAAIGTTSIVGYNLIKGDGSVSTSDNTTNAEKSVAAASDEKDLNKGEDVTESSAEEKDMPSIVQLASPKDAMSIPEIVEKNTPCVVGIQTVTRQGQFMGTGIIMSEDGYIITNQHVVEDAEKVSVKLPASYASGEKADDDELTFDAKIVGTDAQSDIAVLKINKSGLTKAEFGKSGDVKVGEVAIVIGNPLSMELANSVTAGIISSLNRTITIEDRTMNYMQTDASINGGNSGGPLINAYGQVIGIASASVTKSYGEGIGFAIPIDEAIPIIEDLIKNGRVTGRPTLGVSGEDISDIYSRYYDIPKGFRVRQIAIDSAAEKAGIQVNDIIIGIEGQLVESLDELNAVKNKYKAGDTVKISVYRDGEIIDLEVTLQEAASEEEAAEKNPEEDEYEKYREYFNQFPF